jgi:hypothetical protein
MDMTIGQIDMLLRASDRLEARRTKLAAMASAAAWGDKSSQRHLNNLPS